MNDTAKLGKFFNFPIFIQTYMFVDFKRFLNDVFDIAVYRYSLTLEGNEEKRFRDALSFLNVTSGNMSASIRNAKILTQKTPENNPLTGLNIETFFDFYKNEKSEYEIRCLAGFLAVKSILGNKAYCLTNKNHIWARMLGYPSIKSMPEMPTELERIRKRWQMDKLLLELEMNWSLKIYSFRQHGLYVSFDLEYSKLKEMAEMKKYKNKVAAFKEMKKQQLNSNLTTT